MEAQQHSRIRARLAAHQEHGQAEATMENRKCGTCGRERQVWLEEDANDEFINITDVTSDASSVGGAPSETEFDVHRAPRMSTALSDRLDWSDTNLADSGDEDIAREETAYLTTIGDAGDLTSSSLSDLDEERVARIGGRTMDAGVDSGDESDSESSSDETGSRRQRMRARIAGVRDRHKWRRQRRRSHHDSDSMADSDDDLAFDDSELESDQELRFREARTDQERVLAAACGQQDDHEDALLQMHLDQLHAVRNVIQECSSPLLEHAAMESDSGGSDEREITFTYHPGNAIGGGSDDDSTSSLSDDLVGGWASDARRRWYRAAGVSDSDSSLSESKVDRLRLKDDDEEEQSDLYSSDSYQEFYARRAFLGMDGDASSEDDEAYASAMDLDSASLALGVALSMEQQGYSKEDAAVAAAAAAAAAYPTTGARGTDDRLAKHVPTTTITASTNAHGEADPIDGIVSIKSTAPTTSASHRASGAHTPFTPSGWAAAAVVAAATAAGYIDPSSAQQNQHQHQHHASPYVLPRDLNEARAPAQELAATLGNPQMPVESASPDTAATLITQSTSGPTNALLEPSPASSFMPSQLPNSSFYKPLASIRSPIRRASSSSAVNQQPRQNELADSASAPQTAVTAPAGLPLASLAEVNDALSAFADQSKDPNSTRKRKTSDGFHGPSPFVAGYTEDLDKDSRKRMCCDDDDVAGTDAELLVSPQTPHTAVATPMLALGAGAPMHDMHRARLAAIVGSDDDDEEGGSNDDGWLLAMDQLVDTEALMVESPPPSPAADFDTGTVSDISENFPVSVSSLASRSGRGASRGLDLFARWDRIPVNIFKRSRALASSSHRREMISHRDDMMGMVSSLALTAIKSSRQRRALVGSTLLTQHTLPAEPMGRNGALRKTPGFVRNARMHRHASADVSGSSLALLTQTPPPPPPTPLSSRTNTQAADGLSGTSVALSVEAASLLPSGESDGRSTHMSSSIAPAKESTTMGAHEPSSKDISSDEAAADGTGFAERMRDHVRIASGASAKDTSSDRIGAEDTYHHETDTGDGSDCGYAFGWLEDEEDLLLFADPDLASSGFHRPPSMTMVLASSSPMLMPYRSPAAAARNGAASSAAPHHPH
ncbi:hypothetical protein EV179_004859 [Coemansia sp. RSA 487]|nr:hypothetical protein EV179_004859 [Coemansia sp. RSA 487]